MVPRMSALSESGYPNDKRLSGTSSLVGAVHMSLVNNCLDMLGENYKVGRFGSDIDFSS